MSTTMPSASRVDRRNSTSTRYVAPCSCCAGPKTSPRRLCAIMMCSRTVMLYMGVNAQCTMDNAFCIMHSALLVADPMAQRVARLVRQLRHHVGQRVELALAGNQRVDDGVGEQRQRELHPAPRVPARPLGRRDSADLRRCDRQTPRMIRRAERN